MTADSTRICSFTWPVSTPAARAAISLPLMARVARPKRESIRLKPSRSGYSEVELKRFSGHLSIRSLEVYIAHNREAAKRKARAWERHDSTGA
jgi:hypothetical protein